LALVSLLVFVLAVPTSVGAQDEGTALRPLGPGTWIGELYFVGHTSSDFVNSDGSFATTVTDVIDDTRITLEFVVGGDGQVSSGRMMVNLVWFAETVGTPPGGGDPYRVRHAHFETGTLAITGNADRLVAAGELTDEAYTSTSKDPNVEEVSGVETRTVEWVYQAFDLNCARVQATLIQATGRSFMVSALLPKQETGDGYEAHNALETSLLAWPADVEHPDEIWDILENVQSAADAIRDREIPETIHFFDLVGLWGDLNAELASLDECQTEIVGPTPQSTTSWLTQVLRDGVHKALDNPEYYEASDFISLWDILIQEGALTDNLGGKIRGALDVKLDEAISQADDNTILDILAFAALYGDPDLYSRAKAALEGESG
jgi:hypothetical protein